MEGAKNSLFAAALLLLGAALAMLAPLSACSGRPQVPARQLGKVLFGGCAH
jgi:hypothetical protein